jgi:hypothetical protein
MKTTLSVYDFRDAFIRAGRKDQFSYAALGLIFEYLEDQERDLGEEYELDVVGICCELSEESPEEIARNYSIDLEDDGNELNNVLDYLHDETTVIGTTEDGKIVYVQF